jgi:phosphonate transport system substrate-binding protein
MRGDYDLAVAAPHFARVAQVDGRMQPLALYEPRIAGQFITLGDGAVAAPGDVRGKSVAFANPQSLVAMYGRQWLQQQNLEAGKDYEVKPARTDMGVGRMLLTNEVAAAIMSNGEFRGLPPEESSRLKILEVFARIPNFVVLGHPRLGTERLANLKSQLLSFLSDPQDGSAFSKATGITGIVEADEAQLRELDAFVAPTRRAMGGGN